METKKAKLKVSKTGPRNDRREIINTSGPRIKLETREARVRHHIRPR